MKKNLNINSTEWCDVVFENKNKSYGAYHLRQSSSKRHILAFALVVAFMLAIMFVPTLINNISALEKNVITNIDEDYTLIDVEKHMKEDAILDIPKPVIKPPKLIAKEIIFVPPKIVPDNEVDPNDDIHTMDQLVNSDAAIGRFEVPDGSTKAGAISLSDLVDNYKIAEEAPKDDGRILTVVEVMPQYPGGDSELYAYIQKNLKYPVADMETAIQGRVTIRFVVDKAGAISQVTVLRGISPSCDKEAVRVVKSMPKWIPGKQNGNSVAVFFTLPIIFKLN